MEKNESHLPSGVTERVPTISPQATIGEVESLLLRHTRELETINYIYVVTQEKKLEGVVSVKEIFRQPKDTKVADIMRRDIVNVRPHTEKERVALLAIEHNLKSIPVLDAEGRLLGVYPSDVILSILHQENIEDVLRFAGIHRFTDPAKTIITAAPATLIKKRLPWLVVGLGGGLVAASVVDIFQDTLEANLVLAAFIPAVVYIADAVGTQTETLLVRTIAIDRTLNLKAYIWREAKTAGGISTVLGILAATLVYLIWSNAPLAAVIGGAFFATSMTAVAITIMLPLCFRRFKIDPAIASGPFATVITDIASLLIYFFIAVLVFRVWN